MKKELIGASPILGRGEWKGKPHQDKGGMLHGAGNWDTMFKGLGECVETPVTPAPAHGGTQ